MLMWYPILRVLYMWYVCLRTRKGSDSSFMLDVDMQQGIDVGRAAETG